MSNGISLTEIKYLVAFLIFGFIAYSSLMTKDAFLNKCDCNNQSLGHIPGCSLHRIDQIRHTKAHCSVVAATGAQAW